jgi:hypothetical protein
MEDSILPLIYWRISFAGAIPRRGNSFLCMRYGSGQ